MTGIRYGTNTGYQQHMLAKTPPCQPCKDAHTAYQRDYRQRTAAQAAISLPPEAVDTVTLALELELGGQVDTQALRWAAVIALRTALAVLDADRHDPGTDPGGSGGGS